MGLSAQEKAQNKAAAKVRDRAYRDRYQVMKKAVEAAEQAPEVLEAERAFRLADERLKEAVARREARVDELRQQIARLEAEIRAEMQSDEMEFIAADRRAKASEWHALKTSRVEGAENAFPDLQGAARFSGAAWKPPADVLEAMDAARKAATT